MSAVIATATVPDAAHAEAPGDVAWALESDEVHGLSEAEAARRLDRFGRPRLGLDEPAADRVACELDTVAHAEFVEDVLPVTLDGLDADEKSAGDLF
jgi:hypothetical protein